MNRHLPSEKLSRKENVEAASGPPSQKEGNSFKRLKISQIFLPLLLINGLLGVVNMLIYLFVRRNSDPTSPPSVLYDLIAVDAESNLPTWYNSSLWFTLGIVALFIYFLAKSDSHKLPKMKPALLLAIVAFSAAFDEFAQIHERLGELGDALARNLPMAVNIKWTIPGLILAAIISISLFRFVWNLPRRARQGIFLGAAIFLTGAIAVEIFSSFWLERFGTDAYYQVYLALEEFLEMTGVSMALASLVSVIKCNPKQGCFRLSQGDD